MARELDVHQPAHAEAERQPARDVAHLVELGRRSRVRRQHGGRVAGVDAGLLDVLQDAADHRAVAVGDQVEIELDGVLEEAVEQHRVPLGDLRGVRHVAARASPRRGRPPSRGRRARSSAAPAPGSRDGAPRRAPRRACVAVPCSGWRIPSSASSAPKRLRSSARSIASGEVPQIGTPAAARPRASLSGVWPPSWTITPSGFSRSLTASTCSSVSGSK